MIFDVANLLSRVILYTDSVYKRNDLAINDIHQGLSEMFPRYREFANIFFETKSDIENELIVIGQKLNEKNWWIVSSMISSILIKCITDEITQEELDETIVSYFSENDYQNLLRMQDRWNGIGVEEEILIALDQIISAHTNGLYYLTTPAAIPLFERILLQIYDVLSTEEEKTHKISKILKAIPKRVSSERIYNASFLTFLQFYKSGSMEELSDYNRHKISHGHTMGYCTEVISLKSILAFDEVVRFHHFIREAGFLYFNEA